MTGFKPHRLVAAPLIAAAMALTPLAAWATPCDPNVFTPVPDCRIQVQAPVHYDAGGVSGWADHCTGDRPYFWGLGNASLPGNFTWNNDWFTVTEIEFAEGPPDKFDADIFNWNIFGGEDITVSLGCSSVKPPGYIPGCTTTGGPVPDPECKPQQNIHNYCAPGKAPVCFQTYTETCSDKTNYVCTADQGLTSCLQCQ